MKEAGEQFLPLGEEEIERREQRHEKTQRRRGEQAKRSADSLARLLGRNFAENEHHHSHHRRREGDPQIPEMLGKEYRSQGGRKDVDDIVANEDGGEQIDVPFSEVQGPLGGSEPAAAIVFMRTRSWWKNAVSDAEKNADVKTSSPRITMDRILSLSIMCLKTPIHCICPLL